LKNYLKIIKIDEFSITPKYIQIHNSILSGIEEEKIEKGDILPSIYDLSIGLEVSRNTIERAYNELKKIGTLFYIQLNNNRSAAKAKCQTFMLDNLDQIPYFIFSVFKWIRFFLFNQSVAGSSPGSEANKS
jgi:hypothetical protein